jgi:SM-20-related protein
VYPAGAFYKRHRDQHRGSLERLISCVVYLNNEWAESDGGQLRIYDEDGTDFTDITPQAGTVVCFRSDTVEHEVMPALRERYSLTGWLRKDTVL